MQGFFINDHDLSSLEAMNYVTHNMIEMIEREAKDIDEFKNGEKFNDVKSKYVWIIGKKVADVIFPNHPTRIFDFDVIYEPDFIFDSNSINFLRKSYKKCKNCRYGCDASAPCPYNSMCIRFSPYSTPSHWVEMTEAQKLEKHIDGINPNKKLVGDIINGYSYIDTDIAYKIEESNHRAIMEKRLFQLPITNYNEMYIKKEDKKMDIKLYECGTFVGGVVTKPQDLIKNVIFSGPCTIVQWSDGDKTIVKCENEDFDKEKGLAMAIVKKLFGTNESKSNYNDIFKKWIHEEKSETVGEYTNKPIAVSLKKYAEDNNISVSTLRRKAANGEIPAFKINGKWMIRYTEV